MEERAKTAWCACVVTRAFKPGDALRDGVVDFDTATMVTHAAQDGCAACGGKGVASVRAFARANGVDEGARFIEPDTRASLAREWAALPTKSGLRFARESQAFAWLTGLIEEPLGVWCRPSEYGPDLDASPSLIARTEAFVERERAKASLAADRKRIEREIVEGLAGARRRGISYAPNADWSRPTTPHVIETKVAMAHGLSTPRDGIVTKVAPSAFRYDAKVEMYGQTIDMVDKARFDAAQSRIAELEAQLAARSDSFAVIDNVLVTIAKGDETKIQRVDAARAMLRTVRDECVALTLGVVWEAVGAPAPAPHATLATHIAAEPVGMASESDEGGEW